MRVDLSNGTQFDDREGHAPNPDMICYVRSTGEAILPSEMITTHLRNATRVTFRKESKLLLPSRAPTSEMLEHAYTYLEHRADVFKQLLAELKARRQDMGEIRAWILSDET